MRRLIYFISMRCRLFVKFFSFILTFYKKPRPGIYFLMYHSVGENIDLEIDIDKKIFGQQISFLKDIGTIISIEDASKMLEEKKRCDQQYFVITFDDGYRNFLTKVYPVLVKERVPATIYLNTSYLEQPDKVPIDYRVGFSKPLAPLSWSEVSLINQDDLITIGCHGHMHEELTKLSDETIKRDVEVSLSIFREKLGIQPNHFCYPRGMHNRRVIDKIAPFFQSAVITLFDGNPVLKVKENFSIMRIPVLKSDGLFWFKLRIKCKLYLDVMLFNFISRRFLK